MPSGRDGSPTDPAHETEQQGVYDLIGAVQASARSRRRDAARPFEHLRPSTKPVISRLENGKQYGSDGLASPILIRGPGRFDGEAPQAVRCGLAR